MVTIRFNYLLRGKSIWERSFSLITVMNSRQSGRVPLTRNRFSISEEKDNDCYIFWFNDVPLSHGVGHMMLISDAFHVVLSVFVLAVEGRDMDDTRIIDVHVTPHSSESIEVEIVRGPSPLGELISPDLLIDCTGQCILSSHSDHIFVLDSVLTLISKDLFTFRKRVTCSSRTGG